MPKGQFMDSVEFVKGWVSGCKSGLTLKEIAESMGIEYNACAARAKSLAKRIEGLDKFQPAAGKRGRQLTAEDKAAIEALLSE